MHVAAAIETPVPPPDSQAVRQPREPEHPAEQERGRVAGRPADHRSPALRGQAHTASADATRVGECSPRRETGSTSIVGRRQAAVSDDTVVLRCPVNEVSSDWQTGYNKLNRDGAAACHSLTSPVDQPSKGPTWAFWPPHSSFTCSWRFGSLVWYCGRSSGSRRGPFIASARPVRRTSRRPGRPCS